VDPVVTGIAAALGRTPAQVVLRWGVQRGCAVIPKAQDPVHVRENAQVFEFSLSEAQMRAISGLDRHRRFNDPGEFCEKAFNTFFPIFD
jgi:D-xylose reductase